ncbi:hypothetical protein CHS0354_011681 [Potamilus streckersoni]|uniref:Uncharacterized protein n=1 Tax=Potamilus streckersoni TaxID=2493646 RepID=A0AAE0RR96_9BIVA|nr:hypothetical protein CHS0354_011681 [Potamilus streckersoni]
MISKPRDTMHGHSNIDANKIVGVYNPLTPQYAATNSYVNLRHEPVMNYVDAVIAARLFHDMQKVLRHCLLCGWHAAITVLVTMVAVLPAITLEDF